MFSSIYLFQSQSSLRGLFDSFFGGLFLVKGLPIFFQIGFLVSFFLACLAAHQHQKTPSPLLRTSCAIASFGGLLAAAFLLFQPWDEVFIFLKHSLNFAETGNFSFNRNSRVEGIVDFLPFFVLGLLHKLGAPLLETHFFMGIFGGWLCISAGRKILMEMKFPEAPAWSYPLLLIYPPLLLNVSNGFPVLLFSASILWAIFFLFFRKSWRAGCLALSVIPLMRIEGLWFCVLAIGFFWIQNRKTLSSEKLLLGCLFIFLPGFFLTIWRWIYFGSPIPTPVIYKSALGHLLYSLLGLRNLFMDLTATGAFFFFWPLLSRRKKTPKARLVELLGLLLLAFSLPYYFSGGDWFPSAWGRYLFPFAFFVFVGGVGWFFSRSQETFLGNRTETICISILIVMVVLLPFGSLPKLWQELFSHRSSLAGLSKRKGGQSNYRIQQLSQLGEHLGISSHPTDIIGSSEIATIMYFANRDCLDLLGLTNLEIATTPLRDSPKLFSPAKSVYELPFLIFKRLNPEVLFRHRPDFVYAFDFFLKDLLRREDLRDISETDLLKAWTVWNDQFLQMNSSLFGGVEKLLRSGYIPVIVNYGTSFYALYFVSSEARESHFKRMQDLGMRFSILKSNRP